MDFAIRTEHLTKIYAGRVIAVNDMNLEVPKGSVYGLLGPNGAGKTTTLRLLLGLQRGSQFPERPPDSVPLGDLADEIAQQVQWVWSEV